MNPAILLTLLLTLTAQAFEFTGKVVGVTDGDTITVLYQGNKQYKIRLQHIDCPEAAQDFGSKAKKALSAKVFGQVVTIKWDEMDRYKRVLGNVYIGKRWVNLEMVREEMAWHYKYYSKDVAMAAAGRGSGFAAEIVDDEADEEEEECSEHNPQCDFHHHDYFGAAGVGFISRRKLKNSDLVERISMSFSDKTFS